VDDLGRFASTCLIMKLTYTPSRLLDGDAGLLREHALTRWMSRDLLQAATDFTKNIGLIALYAETDKEDRGRYLFWNAPEGWGCEVRSGRTFEQFSEFDQRNAERGWPLLTLHVNEAGIYSAVWLAPNHRQLAIKVLAGYGVTPAGKSS
jgi:hypothetical protein